MQKMLIAAVLAGLALPAAAADSAPAPTAKVEKVEARAKPDGAVAKKDATHLTKAKTKPGRKKHPRHEAQVAPKT